MTKEVAAAVDAYVAAVDAEEAADQAQRDATAALIYAQQGRQERWRQLRIVAEPGIYPTGDGRAFVVGTGDYPPLFPVHVDTLIAGDA